MRSSLTEHFLWFFVNHKKSFGSA
uniref:Uncharacterized protein n=1 Tax=Arundo donax TaxID=35708 RepID=A0A0A9C6V9_ARUDO